MQTEQDFWSFSLDCTSHSDKIFANQHQIQVREEHWCIDGSNFQEVAWLAVSSATSSYVIVPKQFGENDKPAGSNEERTRKKNSFAPKMGLIDAIVIPSM